MNRRKMLKACIIGPISSGEKTVYEQEWPRGTEQ